MRYYVAALLTAFTLTSACDAKECVEPRDGKIGSELYANLSPEEYSTVLTKCLKDDTSIPVSYDNWLSGEPSAFLVLEARFLTTKSSADCIRGKLLALGGELVIESTTGGETDGTTG